MDPNGPEEPEPRPESLRFCWDQLPAVSRTFALVIPVLPHPVVVPVLVAYLLCRMADTIEDDPAIDGEAKSGLVEELIGLCSESRRPVRRLDAFLARWRACQSLPDTPDGRLMEGAGQVLDVLDALPRLPREAVVRCVRVMARGMAEIARRRLELSGGHSLLVLGRIRELEEYCYYVAGTVGEMLTAVFAWYSPRVRLRIRRLASRAVSFGQGLQLTNILKDVYEDLCRGFCWIPRELQARYGLEPRTLLEPGHRPAALRLLSELMGLARNDLAVALEYTLAIPRRDRRLRLFCLWPLFMAVLTLRRLRSSAGQVLTPAKVKISRSSVMAVVLVTKLIFWSNGLLKLWFYWLSRGLPQAVSELETGVPATSGS
jgi:4,4'-diapophytoene synthase